MVLWMELGGLALLGLLVAVHWFRSPHHHHTGGRRLQDSPYNSRAAVYEAYDDTGPPAHPSGDYDGD